MKRVVAFFVVATVHSGFGHASFSGGATVASINIDGLPDAFLNGGGGAVDHDRLTIWHNSGFTVFSKHTEEWEPEGILQFKLLGKSISFAVDLSRVGCACNLAFYLISMPAREAGGGYSRGQNRNGQPPYYCDANMVGGQWCPEIDIMEANTHAFQATPHNCEDPDGGLYTSCDRSGCSANTRNMDGAYGPNDSFRINTLRPFVVTTDFRSAAGSFVGMRTVLSQKGQDVVLDHSNCNSRYLHKLSAALSKGMSLRITYWGGPSESMAWLDSPPCSKHDCSDTAGAGYISNISLRPLSESTPGQDGSARRPSVRERLDWLPDVLAPWECHKYEEDQEDTNWCSVVGIDAGYEYRFTAGQFELCGECWCCKRRAKLSKASHNNASGNALSRPFWESEARSASSTLKSSDQEADTFSDDSEYSNAIALSKMAQTYLKITGVPDAFVMGDGAWPSRDILTVRHNSGVSVFTKMTKEWDPDAIMQFKLLGKTVSFTVDLSQVGCACNLAFYLISMPARDEMGLPHAGSNRGGQPPYYCDANMVGGQWCPEIDIMEANSHAFQATPHRCDTPRHRHYDYCDRGGCSQNTREMPGSYGPSHRFTINTMLPFQVDTAFISNGSILAGIKTTLKQDDRKVVFGHDSCSHAYLAKLTEAMTEGMSLRITYWGEDAGAMAWMDVPPCGGNWNCDGQFAGNATISNVRVASLRRVRPQTGTKGAESGVEFRESLRTVAEASREQTSVLLQKFSSPHVELPTSERVGWHWAASLVLFSSAAALAIFYVPMICRRVFPLATQGLHARHATSRQDGKTDVLIGAARLSGMEAPSPARRLRSRSWLLESAIE